MVTPSQKFQFDAIFEPEHMLRNDPLYSQHHLDSVLAQATLEHYQNGFQTGQQEMQNSVNAVSTGHLQSIHGALSDLLQTQRHIFETLEEHTSAICREITQKMLPVLAEQGAIDEILQVIAQAFDAKEDHHTMKVYVQKDYVDSVTQKVEGIFQDKLDVSLSVMEDAALQTSECRVEWETGGIERLTGHIQNQIDQALDRLTASAHFRDSELKAEILQTIEDNSEHIQKI